MTVTGAIHDCISAKIVKGWTVQRRAYPAFATRSAIKRGWAKAATWTSGVQYFVTKPPALR